MLDDTNQEVKNEKKIKQGKLEQLINKDSLIDKETMIDPSSINDIFRG